MLFFFLLLFATPSFGNGQSTHLWITEHALSHLPSGELHDLLAREDLRPMLRNGTMFPDGGYAVGDDYGEIAHWESFQQVYMNWIGDQYQSPYTDEGGRHLAFFMGMASHGMADQVFDSLFMERSKLYDNWGDGLLDSLDTASDVLFVHETGVQIPPDVWMPDELFTGFFESASGHSVDVNTMGLGQALLGTAVTWVGNVSKDPAQVDAFSAQYPWASEHLFDVETPGSPPCEGAIVALYWQSLWAGLSGVDWAAEPVLLHHPLEGSREHEPLASFVESRITMVFARGIREDSLSSARFSVRSKDGVQVPVDPWLFYGDGSNVVHLTLLEDLKYNTRYTVFVHPGLQGIDGRTTTHEWSAAFRTRREVSSCSGCDGGAQPVWGIALCFSILSLVFFRRRGEPMGGWWLKSRSETPPYTI